MKMSLRGGIDACGGRTVGDFRKELSLGSDNPRKAVCGFNKTRPRLTIISLLIGSLPGFRSSVGEAHFPLGSGDTCLDSDWWRNNVDWPFFG